jgi:hypothetical protein
MFTVYLVSRTFYTLHVYKDMDGSTDCFWIRKNGEKVKKETTFHTSFTDPALALACLRDTVRRECERMERGLKAAYSDVGIDTPEDEAQHQQALSVLDTLAQKVC